VRQERQAEEEKTLETSKGPTPKKIPTPKKNTIECSGCLAELSEDAMFCHKCGQVVASKLVFTNSSTPTGTTAAKSPAKAAKTPVAGTKRAAESASPGSAKKAKGS